MTLSSCRVGYRHRCTIERDANLASEDGWGDQDSPDWKAHLEDVPCRATVDASREPVNEENTAVIEDRRVSVALGTDVTTRDRVGAVTDRKGNTIYEGPSGIEGILTYPDHLELILERIK
jgi:hypothetical protein